LSFIAGSSASLRASGIVRYINATFLVVWLAGWALGEVVALGFLIMLIRSVVGSAAGLPWPIPGGDWIAGGAAGFVLLFLLVWLTLWTVGGLAAFNELLRSLAGEDHISVQPAGVELVRRAGPLRRVRTFDRSLIRWVRIRRHDKAVVMDTTSGTELITTYGTVDERRTMTEWLRRQLSLPDDGRRVDTAVVPPGWTMTVESGTARLSQSNPRAKRAGATIAWAVVGLTGLIWYGSTQTGPASGSVVALVLTLLLASAAAWVTWSHREWLVRHGQLTSHRRFGTWDWERTFKSARLEVAESTDSDNDDRYELMVIDEQGKRTIASEVNDEADIVDLARWLSARTGFHLTLPHGMRSRLTTPVTEDELK
jgi:hypothetical protein